MNLSKWIWVALVGIGLLAFGMKVRANHQNDMKKMSRAPVAVAAIRGGTEAGAESGANVSADYANVLQDNVNLAQKNVDKLQAASASHFGKARDVDNE
jgi:hypothetical protein